MQQTLKRKIKRRKKGQGKSVIYFNKDTEASIVKFLESEDPLEKERIYTEEIKTALYKLVENIIFVYKFHSLDELDILKNDCTSFLYENLHKFDPAKGTKAFSYLSVISRNWFIQKVKNSKKKENNVHFDKNVLNYLEKTNNEHVVFSYEDLIYKGEFIEILKEEIKKWRSKFKKDQEVRVLEAVILLMENPELVSIYNKKGIFLYLKEITGLNTKQIVTNLDKMKKKYLLLRRKYENGDY